MQFAHLVAQNSLISFYNEKNQMFYAYLEQVALR